MSVIGIEEFSRLDIRVGKVISAEPVKGSNKLLKIVADLGPTKRTVVAGIAETHEAKDLLGKNLVFLTNLAPRKIMGMISEGMVLAAEEGGKVYLLTTDGDAPAGARVL